MNSKERIMAAIYNKEVDRVPWAPLIDGYYTSSLPEQGLNMDEIETIKYIGGDIILRHVPVMNCFNDKVEVNYLKKGNEIFTEFITKVGTLTQLERTSGKTTYLVEPKIKTEEDIKIFQYIVENNVFSENYGVFTEITDRIGDDGIATADIPLTPIQVLLQSEMHVEPFTYALFDYQKAMEELMQTMHFMNKKQCEIISASPAKVYIGYEDTSTTVMNPSWFNDYSAAQIDDYADIIHKNNGIYITHMCGKIHGLLSDISKGKQDGVDSVCPPTTGDCHAIDALKVLDDKVIIGGIEPPSLKMMSVEEVKKSVKKTLDECSGYNRFILSTGDATSYGTPIENLLAVTEIVKNYK